MLTYELSDDGTLEAEVIPLTDPELYDGGPYQPQDNAQR